jgi:uncharacterized protein YggE
MRGISKLLVGLLAIGATAIPMRLQADAQESPHTVSTTGEAAIYVAPDEAVVTLGVTHADPVLDKAISANAAACASLSTAIKGLQIDGKDVATAELIVQPQYSYLQGQPYTVVGYSVTREYRMTVRNIGVFENLIQTALQNGANQISGLEFNTSQTRKYHDQARADAVQAAKEKAEALASALGCKVGKPRTIAENVQNMPEYRDPSLNSARSASDEGAEMNGQITVRASISVTFDLIAN